MVDRLSPLGDPGRYLLSACMRKTGTRYLLLCVALIAACLTFVQIPVPPPTVININGDVESAPNAIHSILYNFRGVAYVGAISIFIHAACSVLAMKNLARWIFSILVPTLVTFAYHLWWVDHIRRNEIHYPITISPSTVFAINLISFTIGTAVVVGLFSILSPFAEPKLTTSAKPQIPI